MDNVWEGTREDIIAVYDEIENVVYDLYQDFLDSQQCKDLVKKVLDELHENGEAQISGFEVNTFIREFFNTQFN